MIKTNNISSLLWVVVFLAATNIATVGTIVFHVYFQENAIQNNRSNEIDIPDSRIGQFFRNELNLNSENFFLL